MHSLVEHFAARATHRFSPPHGDVRILEQTFGPFMLHRAQRDPYAHGDPYLPGLNKERLGHRRLHPLCHAERIARITDPIEQDGELVSTEPEQYSVSGHMRLAPCG